MILTLESHRLNEKRPAMLLRTTCSHPIGQAHTYRRCVSKIDGKKCQSYRHYDEDRHKNSLHFDSPVIKKAVSREERGRSQEVLIIRIFGTLRVNCATYDE